MIRPLRSLCRVPRTLNLSTYLCASVRALPHVPLVRLQTEPMQTEPCGVYYHVHRLANDLELQNRLCIGITRGISVFDIQY